MADFRKSILLLVGVLLLAGLAVAQPQPSFSCFANAGVPPLARSEGLTENLGDLILNCTGGIPTAPGAVIPPVNIQIFLNTSVTSRIMVSSTAVTEALLILDDPGATNPSGNLVQAPCTTSPLPCANHGNGQGGANAASPNYYVGQGTGANFNVFQGQLVGTNSILWLGVPIDPPGTNGTRIIRITNIRANANALGVAGSNATPTPIIEVVSATGTFSVPINNPQQTVAFIQKSLSFTVGSPAVLSLQQCFSQSSKVVATLNYTELLATAFKKYNVGSSDAAPTATAAQNDYLPDLNTETMFYNPNFPTTNGLNVVGLASFGTRLKAVFNNVPTGVALSVSLVPSAVTQAPSTVPAEYARLVTSETGAYAAASSGDITLSAGTGQAVWEVTESNAQAFTTLSFEVKATYTADPGNNRPALGTATVNGSYAPVSTATNATTGPIPRFADTSTAQNIFTIVPCVSNLLFPFVTNQIGFDTGLAIASTSTDPFGTSPQNGTCNLYWYGANAPATTLTPTVTSGTVWTGLASLLAPNFQGYMIAVCRFQYAHGFAFVSDVGARNVAMGYLALVIPDPASPRHPAPNVCGGTGTSSLALSGCQYSGEQLGQ